MGDEPDELDAAIFGAIRYARTGEKLVGVARALKLASDALGDLLEYDPELHPELAIAHENVVEAIEAVARGLDFADARNTVALEKAKETAAKPPTKGDQA